MLLILRVAPSDDMKAPLVSEETEIISIGGISKKEKERAVCKQYNTRKGRKGGREGGRDVITHYY